ncbi:hypothetical protein HZB03_05690, partial [Candidatus Woesearchaeota archaeon]|nr:hypothetical protein [Candidatus Woesearchaeota archaeon]
MEKKNLIQIIGTNVRSFLLGAALASGITYIAKDQLAKDQPLPRLTEQVQSVGYWDHKTSNWIPPETAIYRVHRDPVDSHLNYGYVEVDKKCDGESDQIVKFQHKTPPKENPNFFTPSTIELYERVT